MKKISILGLSMLALLSCTKSYKVTEVSLLSTDDSVNYALGFLNGYQIKEMALPNDSSDESIAEFIDALQRGYDGKVEELSETQKAGRDFAGALKMFEEKGLVGQAAWTLNEKILLQGLVNGLLRDSTMMMADEARNYFQEQYQAMMQNAPASDTNPAKAIKAKCGKKAGVIKLADQIDSLNYAFGLLNGSEIAQYVLAQDSTGEEFKVFVKAVNKGLKSNTKNPQLVEQGEQIGKTIKEQEAMGLLNIPQLATNFEMLKQGFINGMYKDEKQMTMDQANQYLSATISNIQFGENKKKCEQFLAENKLKEGVTVTASGLQYEVLKMGKGPKPTATDKVKVHYHGTLIDGTVFDSSVERGEPITFPLNQVIAGWTEGLQLMPVGSKFRFYIPQELGYGAQGMGASIPGYSTLIFEVELLGIEK